VEHAGKVVSNKELTSRVWPNIDVGESNLRVHVATLRKTLEEGQPGVKYVTNIPGRGYCFVAPIGRVVAPTVAPMVDFGASDEAHGLPPPLTRMVGRHDVVAALSDLLAEKRFVTILGPGGIGKTTVAVAVGHAKISDFDGAVVFFDLGPLRDPGLVPSAMASALGLSVQSSDPTPNLISFLRDRRTLLVLDCCEHVVDAVAIVAERVFKEAPRVHILATSRESLRVEGEYVYRLPVLNSPPESTEIKAAHALSFPAVQLFVERADASVNGFELGDADAPIVAEMCRKLDGIALAIELAAGRVSTHGIRETAALLDSRFRLLWPGRRTALPRHQTLSATLDWSYDLLSEVERVVLCRLSVFVGFFTLEAATAVAASASIDSTQVLDSIASLVAKSLVSSSASKTISRFRLLDSTRAYALTKLADSGELQQAARRHAMYFRDLFTPARNGRLVALGDLTHYIPEMDNVRSALDWAFSPGGDKALGVALTAAYAPVWLHLSLLAECRDRVECARDNIAAASSLIPPLKAQLLTILGIVQVYTVGASERIASALDEALRIAESLDDSEAQLQALYASWIHRFNNGEHRTSQKLAEQIAVIAPRTRDPADTLLADRLLGSTNHYGGNQSQAEGHFRSLLDRHTAPSGSRRVMWLHYDDRVLPKARLARVLWMRGSADSAIQVAKESLEEARDTDHKLSMCFALGEAICPLQLMAGNIAAATQYIATLAELADRYSFAFWVRFGHCLEGSLLIKRGDAARGSTLLRAALEDLGSAGQTLHCSGFITDLAEALASLGNLAEASAVIDNELALSRREGVLWHTPELLRMKGELSVQQFGDQSLPAAERLFSEALQLAQDQDALFWELRAAVSFARLKIRQYQPTEARQELARICEVFAGTTEFSDLRIARELLAGLPAGIAGDVCDPTA
jgi:predicted ATPase